MGKEIERKFLVTSDEYKKYSHLNMNITQGYLADGIRIRIVLSPGIRKGYITIKSTNPGIVRDEYEYEIPLNEANELLYDICKGPLITKTRYCVYYENNVWEIDEFHEDNEGLVVAELELDFENSTFSIPPWIGKEVTDERKYYNADLIKNPFNNWKNDRTV